MNIIPNIATSNICYRANQNITPKSVTLYCQETDMDLNDVVLYYKMHAELDYGIHVIISNGNKGYQLIPYTKRCWHSGNDNVNNSSIAVLIIKTNGISTDNILQNIIELCCDLSDNVIGPNITIDYGDNESKLLLAKINKFFSQAVMTKVKEYIENPKILTNDIDVIPANKILHIGSITDKIDYTLDVNIKNLKIKSRPCDDSSVVSYMGHTKLRIVDETKDDNGKVWGLIDSYVKERNGWVKLELIK